MQFQDTPADPQEYLPPPKPVHPNDPYTVRRKVGGDVGDVIGYDGSELYPMVMVRWNDGSEEWIKTEEVTVL